MIKLLGKEHDLGAGMVVHRILPNHQKRMVGPFCFLDHLGPVTVKPHQETDIRPHPHIGLSTLTYFFEGRSIHRDSLGTEALIAPGDVNWMTSGRGISHSERAHPEDRSKTRILEGLQLWVALPDGKEDIEPSFQHYDSKSIPTVESSESKITIVAGEGFGLKSPVVTTSPLVLIIIESKRELEFEYSSSGFELGLYVAQGAAESLNEKLQAHQMFIFENGVVPTTKVQANSRIVILGGEAFSTPRYLWWNLVSSSREKIEAAKNSWKLGMFPMVPGETEFIPSPENEKF